MNTASSRINWVKLSPWLYTVGMFLFWEAACWLFSIPVYFLPSPTVILHAFSEFRIALWENSIQTLWTTLVGFGIAIVFGMILGLIIGWSKNIYNGIYPIMVGFNSVPKVAVVPILVLWFGIGWIPAVLTAFLISFFPIVVNVATGLATIEPEMEDVLRALGANKFEINMKVGIPRSLPYFFASLKIAITLAFVGSVISETVAANKGIGHMMLIAQANFEVPLVFAGLIALAVEGIGMYAIMAFIEKRMTGWAHRSDFSTQQV
ncbi:MAG TPA: ABC transporter permease [Sulfurimonas sp.]|nr:ABC transporter permease [Sulfurimonas sp.]